MITFMTTFKPFTGDDETRQRNALLSWLSLGKGVEVLVFGVPPAPDDLIAQFNIKNYPDANWNGTGMPTVDEMFDIGQRDSYNEWLAYVNGDIVLGADFIKALCTPTWKRFLLVGQRWETDYLKPIENASPEAVERFRNAATRQGALNGLAAIDFLGFPKGTFPPAPPLVPGGIVWDGYMIYYSKKRHIPVIDATSDVLAIHQNHPYKRGSTGERDLDAGPAARNNFAVAAADNPKYIHTPFCLGNAQYFLKDGHLHSTLLAIPYAKHRLRHILIKIARWTRAYQVIRKTHS